MNTAMTAMTASRNYSRKVWAQHHNQARETWPIFGGGNGSQAPAEEEAEPKVEASAAGGDAIPPWRLSNGP